MVKEKASTTTQYFIIRDGHSETTSHTKNYHEAKKRAEHWIREGAYRPNILPCTIKYSITSVDSNGNEGVPCNESLKVDV